MINRITKPIVYVLDSDATHSSRLAAMLREEDMEVRVYDTVEYFLHDVSTRGPACLVLEMELPRCDGLEVQRQLKQRRIDIPVLFFARRPSIAQCVAALDAGAVAFIEKPAPADRLLKAIRTAVELHSDQQGRLADRAEILRRIGTLTDRELQTLQMLLDGCSVKQVSKAFQIGNQTVAKHRARGLAKMKARNDALLVRLCLSHGIEKLTEIDLLVEDGEEEPEEQRVRASEAPPVKWIDAPALALADRC
ncbi:MAG: response regulator [Planctomycetales bacterium]|nr:response regulator [Planctomycetales bacterium]NIO72537.1 response regulator [Anaerolineae bacterium]NIQ19085.1 response regulator [Gammaproteobacteria bacterium]NIM09739.1 response regulator [Planctomycetales bacterium]NIN78311.1 response regulator [Planctomycetales bacterium]